MARVVPGDYSGLCERSWSKMTKTKDRSGRPLLKKSPTVGARIIEGLEEALAWSKGEEVPVRVTHVQVPDVDVLKVRRRMGLSPTQFALKFGFPPRHAPELGTGTRSSRYANPSAVGRDRKASGECRGRFERLTMSGRLWPILWLPPAATGCYSLCSPTGWIWRTVLK
jgi:hypothetical protein